MHLVYKLHLESFPVKTLLWPSVSNVWSCVCGLLTLRPAGLTGGVWLNVQMCRGVRGAARSWRWAPTAILALKMG